jgi:hypothetical protein
MVWFALRVTKDTTIAAEITAPDETPRFSDITAQTKKGLEVLARLSQGIVRPSRSSLAEMFPTYGRRLTRDCACRIRAGK